MGRPGVQHLRHVDPARHVQIGVDPALGLADGELGARGQGERRVPGRRAAVDGGGTAGAGERHAHRPAHSAKAPAAERHLERGKARVLAQERRALVERARVERAALGDAGALQARAAEVLHGGVQARIDHLEADGAHASGSAVTISSPASAAVARRS